MTEKNPLTIGQRVKLLNKDVKGTVAYMGYPTFATGKWIGVVLDEPKGKNNGTVRGHAYFTCDENHGAFVRITQIQLLDDEGNPMETSFSSSSLTPGDDSKRMKQSSVPLPTAQRSRPTTSRTSLTDSRQSLVGIAQGPPPAVETSTPEQSAKKSSFIEYGFVETLRPQFTLGQSIASPVGASPVSSVEDKLVNLQAQQEISKLKAEVEDLQEKLETLRIKRAEDREKLKELERLRLSLDQANEFKAKIMAAQAQLQRDLQRAKQETREAQEALETRMDDTAELSEAVEMAVLDKEMAEERAEALQQELEHCRDKLEEATLDLQLMKAEMEAGGQTDMPYAAAGAPPTSGGYELKQMEQQNARLRETLVRLRDLSAHDKHQMGKMQKDLEQCKSEIAELSRTKEKLSSKVEELENQMSDLHEQVDAALGAEEMVEQLTDKKLDLEEKIEEMRQEISELEALQEVHEQLVESNRELEMDLREELELAQSAKRECIREKEAALETVLDREATINKFRELVHKLHEECNSLRSQLHQDKQESSAQQVDTYITESLTTMQSRAPTRSVELQLRSLELEQARQAAEMLRSCLPDHFLAPQGDYDAMLLILLLKRLTAKADIISGQVREKFQEVTAWDRESLVKSHTLVQYSFRCQLQYHLYMIQWLASSWSLSLERCSVEQLQKAASALPDAAAQERSLDNIIALIKQDELDENSSMEGVERCWVYLQAMWSALCGTSTGCGANHALAALNSLSAGLHADCSAVHALLPDSERGEEMALLVLHVKSSCEAVQQQLKTIRRRLPNDDFENIHPQLWESLWSAISSTGSSALRAARACGLACRAAHRAAAAQHDAAEPPALPHKHLKALLTAACDKIDDVGPEKLLRQCMEVATSEINSLARFIQEKEYDVLAADKKQEKAIPPIVTRFQLVKKQLEETKTLTIKLENKEVDIKELRKAVKAKSEELSELQIRRELGERKLLGAAKEAEQRAEKAETLLSETLAKLHKKEKEFEETMDHLQQDIDSLENERGALRDKLKSYKRPHGAVEESSPVKVVNVPAGENNEALQHQLKLLSWAVSVSRAERASEARRVNAARLAALRPLHQPAHARTRNSHAKQLRDKLHALHYDWAMFRARCGLVKFPNEPGDYAKALQQHRERVRIQRIELEKRLLEIQIEIKEAMMVYRPWRVTQADLATFPTADLTKTLESAVSSGLDIGDLTCPSTKQGEQTVFLTLEQFDRLKRMVRELSSDEVKFEYRPEAQRVVSASA